jgi:hypothetical protein
LIHQCVDLNILEKIIVEEMRKGGWDNLKVYSGAAMKN